MTNDWGEIKELSALNYNSIVHFFSSQNAFAPNVGEKFIK